MLHTFEKSLLRGPIAFELCSAFGNRERLRDLACLFEGVA